MTHIPLRPGRAAGMLGVQGRYGEADMDIGSRIREHRAAAGMKQDELAQACFVSRQTIRNWGTEGV